MRKKKQPEKTLNLHSAGDFSITDNTGAVVAVPEAKRRYESGEVDDCNVAFITLISHNFDIEATKAYYLQQTRTAC